VVKRRLAYGIAGLLFALGGWQAGGAVWIHAKAQLAQVLIARAWAEAQTGGTAVRPWPWADTAPVAKLAVPALGIEQFVLAGASGRTMAFGPGYMDGTANPGDAGMAVITAHRDTHFRFLRQLRTGHEILVTDRAGRTHRYRVVERRVVDSEKSDLAVTGDSPRLALVTCYPFDAIETGGPLRYVVFADLDASLTAGLATRP
jgi:sortase A